MATKEGDRRKKEAARPPVPAPSPSVPVKCAEWLIRAMLGAVLAAGRVLGQSSPFGVALVGACGGGSGGLAALVGAAFGYLVSRGAEAGLRYTAAALITFSVSFAFYDLGLYRRGWFMPLVAAAVDGLTGAVTRGTSAAWTAGETAALLGEMALTAIGVYAFRLALTLREGDEERQEPGGRRRWGVVLLALAALSALGELTLLETVSVGRTCACLVTLCAAAAAGPGAGAAVGVAGGLVMDLSLGSGSLFAMTYALCGLTAGLLRRRGRVAAALAALCAVGLAALWSWDAGVPAGTLYEAGIAALAFLFFPQRVLDRGAALMAGEPREDPAEVAAHRAAQRLRDTAGAFGEVFAALRNAFQPASEPAESPNVVFDRAADRVCARCVLRDSCWQTAYQDTHDLLASALPGLLEEGRARPEHFPQRFRDRCVKFPALLVAIQEELTAHLLRLRYTSEVSRSRRAVCTQYGDMAQALADAAEAMAAPLAADAKRTRRLQRLLWSRELTGRGLVFADEQGRIQVQLEGDAARELGDEAGRALLSETLDIPLNDPQPWGEDQLLFRQREPLAAVAGAAGRRREGMSVTGDAGGWFKDDRGRVFLMLCDGMGSGPEAQRDSRLTLRLLERFLRAGVAAESALRTVNQALLLRGEETGSFSTIDLLTLDLYTGQGALYKLGAAPSYLKRGGAVSRLTGVSLPAGLTDGPRSTPDRTPFQAAPGDCVVLLSDGAASGDDADLRAALSRFDGDSPTALAQTLADRGDPTDDRTVLVLKVTLREDVSDARSA